MPVTPDPSKVLGTDISAWQDAPSTPEIINFQQMATEGAKFVIIKAGQNIADPDFKLNWKNSKGILPRGSYWFYSTVTDPKIQAERWIETLGEDLGEFYLWLDLEEDFKYGKFKGWDNWYKLIARLKQLVPHVKLGIYTNYYYWLENTKPSSIPKESLEYFGQFPLWIAQYPTLTNIPRPWTTHLLHQFTDYLDGHKFGVESIQLDGNYFNGTLEDLYALTNWYEQNQKEKITLHYKDKIRIYEEI